MVRLELDRKIGQAARRVLDGGFCASALGRREQAADVRKHGLQQRTRMRVYLCRTRQLGVHSLE